MRLAGAVAERKIAEQEARHGGVLDDVLGAAHDHGGNAVRLQVARDQAAGLMAHWAVRHQDDGVRTVLPAAAQDLRRVGLDRDAVAAVGRRAVESRRDRPNAPCRRRTQQRR